MGNGAVTPDIEGPPTGGLTADTGGYATTEGAPASASPAAPTYQPPTATPEGGPPTTSEGLNQPSAQGNFMEIPSWLGGPQGPLGQILGGMAGQAGGGTPPGAQIQQRHGGFLTGLAGVLIEGLASGMAPTAQQASMMPIMMEQARTQHQQMQLQQVQMQEELAMAPVRMKLELAQAQMYGLNAMQMARELGIESDIGPASRIFAEKILTAGNGHKMAEFPDFQSAMKASQQFDAQKKDQKMVFFQYPTTGDPHGPWTVWQAYPDKTLQEPIDFDMPPDQYGNPGQHIHVDAGTDTAGGLKTALEQAHGDIANRRATTMNNVAAAIYQDDMRNGKDPSSDPMFAHAAQFSTAYQGMYKAAASDVGKAYKDFNERERAIEDTRSMLAGAHTGNEVMAALVPVQTILMTMQEGKVRRVNALELNRADPNYGDLVRRVDTIIERALEGKLPEGYEKDLNALLSMYEKSNLAGYRDMVDNYNAQRRTDVPYGTADMQAQINALPGPYERGTFSNGYVKGTFYNAYGPPTQRKTTDQPAQPPPTPAPAAQPAGQAPAAPAAAPAPATAPAQTAPAGTTGGARPGTIPIQTPGQFSAQQQWEQEKNRYIVGPR